MIKEGIEEYKKNKNFKRSLWIRRDSVRKYELCKLR